MHNVSLFSFIETEDERKYQHELQNYCEEVILIYKPKIKHLIQFAKGFFNGLPFQVNYYNFPSTKIIISKIVRDRKIDLIYAHLIRMALSVKEINCWKILDYTDAISMEYVRSLPHRKSLLSKIFFSWEAKRTKRFEKLIISDFEEAWFISQEDIDYLKFGENPKIKLVPNPVNIGEIKQDYSLQNRIIFVGNMSVPHNIFAVQYIAKQIMPKLLTFHQVEFRIIGAHPAKEVLQLDKKNNTKVIGFAEDLNYELKKSDIFVAPMFFSAGVQNKVLEAMAVGLPVITTKNVARSIMAENNKEIKIANTSEEYVSSIKELLKETNKRITIGTSGYKHIKLHFSMHTVRKIIGVKS